MTRLELQRYVAEELEDWNYHVEPESIARRLNRAQDRFTRDTNYLQAVSVQSITSGTSRYEITPASGYRVGVIRLVQFYDGSTDDAPLEPMTVSEMTDYYPDWRNRDGSRPTHFVRNYDPETADTPRNESIWLYPSPDTSYTNGLRVTYSTVTDGQMTADATAMALPERIGVEALIAYVTAEILRSRAIQDPEAAQVLLGEAKRREAVWDQEKERAVREASTGFSRKARFSRTHWV